MLLFLNTDLQLSLKQDTVWVHFSISSGKPSLSVSSPQTGPDKSLCLTFYLIENMLIVASFSNLYLTSYKDWHRWANSKMPKFMKRAISDVQTEVQNLIIKKSFSFKILPGPAKPGLQKQIGQALLVFHSLAFGSHSTRNNHIRYGCVVVEIR